MTRLPICLLAFGLFSSLLMAGTPVKNVCLISIDGTSRKTLYALLQKKKLPHIARIVKKGGVRNMTIGHLPTSAESGFKSMMAYRSTSENIPDAGQSFPAGQTLLDAIPGTVNIRVILAKPHDDGQSVLLSASIVAALGKADHYEAEEERTYTEVTEKIIDAVDQTAAPFFIFANYNDVDALGHRFREGAAVYSDMLEKIDSDIGHLLTALEESGHGDKTVVILTTNYGFFPNSRRHEQQDKSWVIASEKMYRKGVQGDIPVSVLDQLGVDVKPLAGEIYGRSIFRY